MDLPRAPIPESNLTSYMARFHAATKQMQAGGSDTVSFTTTHNGTVFEVKDHVLAPKNLVTGFEEYVDGNGYNINALVYVKTGKGYIDGDKNTFVSIPGVYICVSPVPPKVDLTIFDDSFLTEYYTKVTQRDGIVYAPIVIENDSRDLAYKTEDGKGKFWHLIAPAVSKISNCSDGDSVTTYAAAQEG